MKRRLLIAACLAPCLAALVVGGMGAAQFRLAFAQAPLLVRPHGLAVDEEGLIYVGVAGIQVHVYTPEGKIVNGWVVDGNGDPLRLELRPDAVAVANAERAFLFGRDGSLRESPDDATLFERIGPERDRRVETGGTVYRLEGMTLVRETPDAAVLVAEPPWPLRALPHRPLVFALLLLAGAGGLIVIPFLLRVRSDG